MLEKELQEIIALTSQELEEYREKVLELEDEVGRVPSPRAGRAQLPPRSCAQGEGACRGRSRPVARAHPLLPCAI